jgi:hypothetical protein
LCFPALLQGVQKGNAKLMQESGICNSCRRIYEN